MKLKPFDPRWTAIVAAWLNEEENWKWLQFGSGCEKPDPLTFRMMIQSPEHEFHLYFEDSQNQPIGLVAVSDIDHHAKTGRLWFVLGDKNLAGKGYTKGAVNEYLRYAFIDLGLNSITAHTVSENEASIRILENCNFNFIGRRRQCLPVKGKFYDQMLFDLLASEFLDTDIQKYHNVLRLNKKFRTKRPVSTTIAGPGIAY